MKIGDQVPDILGRDENGVLVSRSDYAGRKWILYFYPKDNTSGCTAQACSLRDGYVEIRRLGYDVVGVSIDGQESHRKFIRKNSLPFRLIADESKELFLPFRLIGMNAARDGEQIAVIQIERSPAGDVQFAGLVQDFIDELIRRFRREFRIRCGEIEGEFLEFAAAFFLADSFVHSSLAPIVDYTPASVAL